MTQSAFTAAPFDAITATELTMQQLSEQTKCTTSNQVSKLNILSSSYKTRGAQQHEIKKKWHCIGNDKTTSSQLIITLQP